MSDRATCWSVTINNPIKADEDNISLARQKGWKVDGQKEVGKEGTPHYQLVVKTPQVRFSALKKAFPRSHIEKARNVTALEQYVVKEETRVGELPTSDKFPSLQQVWEMFYMYCISKNYIDLCNYYFRKWHREETGTRESLEIFDEFCDVYIRKGYVLGPIACNPSVRSNVKKFALAELESAYNRKTLADRQTDRQTEESSEVNSITDTDASEQNSEATSQSDSKTNDEEDNDDGSSCGTGSESNESNSASDFE